jgi:hypothetical protein
VDRIEHPRPGMDVGRGRDGRAKYIHDDRRGITINHGPNNVRRIETMRRDGSRVVSVGRRGGFVEHRFADRGGRPYLRRTYVYGGRTYVNVYRGYPYRGVVYYRYVPAFYYRPVFYVWVYNPWAVPVYYRWGWYGAPWYAPYGYYFAPYPVYPSAAFWLVDFVIAENLRAAYEAQAEANANAAAGGDVGQPADSQQSAQNTSVTLTPEVKQMIADEVKAQLAAQKAAAEQGNSAAPPPAGDQPAADRDEVPPALDPNLRVFIVTSSLDVAANGQACSLSPGDVLMRTENDADEDDTVGVNVISSIKSDCAMGLSVRVQVADLQEMHNQFRAQLDTGLKNLADNQGKNGLPSGPAGAPAANPGLKGLPTAPDQSVAADLDKQKKDADQAEKEARDSSSSGGGRGKG